MTPSDIKSLKRLAAMCRKAGILHFKNEQFEFTLTEDVPVTAKQKIITPMQTFAESPFQSDTLTDDALLYWSIGNQTEDLKGSGDSQ